MNDKLRRLDFSFRVRVGLLVVFWLALFTATHIPLSIDDTEFSWFDWLEYPDKLFHFVGYALLAILLIWTMRARVRLTPANLLLSFFALVLYAAADEALQMIVPTRHCDIWDWLTDVAGAATGQFPFVLVALTQNRQPSKQTTSALEADD